MALRYLDLPEPKYVPTYNTLNQNLLAQSDAAVQQQGALAQQYRRDELDLAAEATVNTFDNLGEKDQQFARERFERTRKRLGEIAQEQGSRSLMPFVDQEVSSLERDLSYHKKASEMKRQASAMVAENEELPTDVKQLVLNKDIEIKYDDQGKAVGVEGAFNQRDLSIAANWESFDKFLQDFNSKARKANTYEGRFDEAGGGFATQATSGEINDYRKIVEQVDGNELMLNNMSALLSSQKMREQLQLLGKLKLEQYPDNVSVSDETGRVTTTVYTPKRNSQGEYVDAQNKPVENVLDADVEKKPVEYSSLEEWQAAELSKPYADRDSYYRQRYETQKATGRKSASSDLSESQLYTAKTHYQVEEKSAPDFFKEMTGQVQQLEDSNQATMDSLFGEMSDFYKTDDPMEAYFDSGDIHFKVGNDNISKDDLFEKLDNQIQASDDRAEIYRLTKKKQRFRNRIGILEENEAKANAMEKTLEGAKRAVKNRLKDDEQLGKYADVVDIGLDGSVSLNPDKLEQKIRRGELKEDAVALDTNQRLGIDTDEIQEGQVVKVPLIEYGATIGGPRESTNTVLATRIDDKIKYYEEEEGKIGAIFSKAADLQQEYVNQIRDAGEIKNVTGVQLNPRDERHKGIIETYEHAFEDPMTAGGDFIKPNGEAVEADEFDSNLGHRFVPVKINMVEGEPVITGYAVNEDGNPMEDLKNISVKGEKPRSMAQDIYGEDYKNVLVGESLKSFFPKLVNDGETVTLTESMVNNLLPTDFKNDFKVKYKQTERSTGDTDSFRVYDGDKFVFETDNAYDIGIQLLQYYKDSRQ